MRKSLIPFLFAQRRSELLIPYILESGMLRILCPNCRFVFLQITPVDEGETVVCPRCATVFQPKEEELVDPEDDS